MTLMMDFLIKIAVFVVAALAVVTVCMLVYHAITDWFKGLDDIPKSDDYGQAD